MQEQKAFTKSEKSTLLQPQKEKLKVVLKNPLSGFVVKLKKEKINKIIVKYNVSKNNGENKTLLDLVCLCGCLLPFAFVI